MTTPNNLWDDQAIADLVGLHLLEPASESGQNTPLSSCTSCQSIKSGTSAGYRG